MNGSVQKMAFSLGFGRRNIYEHKHGQFYSKFKKIHFSIYCEKEIKIELCTEPFIFNIFNGYRTLKFGATVF